MDWGFWIGLIIGMIVGIVVTAAIVLFFFALYWIGMKEIARSDAEKLNSRAGRKGPIKFTMHRSEYDADRRNRGKHVMVEHDLPSNNDLN